MKLRPLRPLALLSLIGPVLVGCGDPAEDADVGAVALRISQTGGDDEAAVAAAVSVSDSQGAPVDLESAGATIVVEASVEGGAWEALADVEANFQGPHRLDVMLVADNSGSQVNTLVTMQEAMHEFGPQLMVGSAHDRVGLVRASTEARLLQAPTDDPTLFAAAVDELFVANGWTALWDAVRLANETLAATPPVVEASGGKARFCADRTHRAILAFTDGKENNSADQHDTGYEGDGIDTTFEELVALEVGGVKTPVHWVGIGDTADAEQLEGMADATDARFVAVDDLNQLKGALTSAAARLRSQVPICFELTSCGHVELRLTVEFELDGARQSLVADPWAAADCTCTGKKRTCTLVAD